MLRSRTVSRRATSIAAAVTLTAAVVACGGGDDDDGSSGTAGSTDTVTDVSLVPATQPTASVPDVVLPDTTPTELVKTVIAPGEGEPAVDGQIVVVDYVGVRSEDGEQFDTSYGRAPFPVTLGAGRVIPGWEEGLVGAQAGERLQLDIPADLAYGDQPQGEIIQPGDALSFVIDVRSVVPGDPPAPGDVQPSPTPVAEVTTDDVRPGTGPAIAIGDTGLFHIVALRADDATQLQSSWDAGQAQPLPLDAEELPPGLAEALDGMQVGGRRVVTVPYDAETGLTPESDLVLVLDLLAID